MFLSSLPLLAFIGLLIVFLPWPLISITLAVQFVACLFAPEPLTKHPLEVYLPRLPADVVSLIASHLHERRDFLRLALASRETYHPANRRLYQRIVLEEDPSSNIPCFRRRLYRLAHCLTKENASYVRFLDFSKYADIDDTLALKIITQGVNLTEISLPAIQVPLKAPFGAKGMVIKQPVFLSTKLAQPIYSTINCLTWTGPFIPFREPSYYAGRQVLPLFRNLRSLTLIYRPDSFASGDDDVKCANAYQPTAEDAASLTEDLWCVAVSCAMLKELTFPFWETVYSVAGATIFKPFRSLQRVHFLALDGPMKDADYGRGILKFIYEMNQMGIQVTFDNPYRTALDIFSLVDELDLNTKADGLPSATFGPIGSPTNPWQGRTDVLNRLEWVTALPADRNREITLRWPITNLSIDEPQFQIPPIFNSIEFIFNTPVSRGDGRQFLKWRKYLSDAVNFPNIRKIRVEMERVDAFYLAFPFFMQYQSNRTLTFQVQRLALSDASIWIRRQWKVKRGLEGEEEVRLEELAKDDIHVHPARLFERNLSNLMFCGEGEVEEITCVFQDRYSRS